VSEIGWKRGGLAVVAVLILAAGLGFLWLLRQHAAPESGPAATPPSATVPAATSQPEPTLAATPTIQPPPPAPSRQPREMPKPASPEPSASIRIEEKAPPPAEPVHIQEAPPSPSEPTPGDAAGQDLPKLAGDLVETTEKLIDVYKDHLGKKEDGGTELTDADNQLTDEIEALADQADHFNKGVNKNVFARTWSHMKKTDQQADVLRRAQEFTAQMTKVEKLMGQVQPGSEVRQGWQEVRRRWGRVMGTLGGR
jgi:type IV secretory pathway VirB10-like protein